MIRSNANGQEKPLISVIIPVYNVERFLDRCIQSLIVQTYENLEILLIDDGSSDKSKEKCDWWSAKDWRIMVSHNKNGGAAYARNRGIDLCNGEYIAFVDADDYIAPECIETLFKNLLGANADISVCSAYYVVEEKLLKKSFLEVKDGIYSGYEILEQYFEEKRSLFTSPWPKLYKREIFKNIRFPEGMKKEDAYILAPIYCMDIMVICENSYLYYYFQRDGSLSNLEIDDEELLDRLRYRKYHFKFFDQKGIEPLRRMALEAYSNTLINTYFDCKNRKLKRKIRKQVEAFCKKLLKYHIGEPGKWCKYAICSLAPWILNLSPARIKKKIGGF